MFFYLNPPNLFWWSESQDLIILAYTDGQDSNSDVNHNSKDSGVFFGENDTLASQKMFHF